MGSATFAQLLRQYRIAAGFSQEHLASLARISTESVGALERGVRRAPYRTTIEQLAAAMNLSDEDRASLVEAADRGRSRSASNSEPKAVQTNLPTCLSSFVGRGDDIARVQSLLQHHRLATITGFGGIGKTRLATETARLLTADQADEVGFVDLAPIRDGEFVAATIASSVPSIASSRIDSIETVASTIGEVRAFLILDNCEHLIEHVARAAYELLRRCPNLMLLATSREPLNISGESVYRLPSLSLPRAGVTTFAEARRFGAIELFVARAYDLDARVNFTDASTAALVDICRRLEGVPLAIEIAVARLPSLGLAVLSERLAASLLAARPRPDMPRRQQTMLATISWSYVLLSEGERALLRRLSIFVGGFTLAAAEAVCAGEELEAAAVLRSLSALVDKSLVTVSHREPLSRYTLLETVRSFGLEQLVEVGERDVVARRHAQWLVRFGERLHNLHWMGETHSEVLPEFENIRAALVWCMSGPDEHDAILAANIVMGLAVTWTFSGREPELRQACLSLVSLISDEQHPIEVMRLLGILAAIARGPDAAPAIERAILLHEKFADRARLTQFYCNLILSYSRMKCPKDADNAARRAVELAVADGIERSMLFARILVNRSAAHADTGRFEQGRRDLTDAGVIAQDLGNVEFVKWYLPTARMILELTAGNYADALALARVMLANESSDTKRNGVLAREGAVICHLMLGDLAEAEAGARDLLRLARASETAAIQHLATVAALRGNAKGAARLLGFIDLGIIKESLTYDFLVSSLRKQLGPDELLRLSAEGSRYTLDRAALEAQDVARASPR